MSMDDHFEPDFLRSYERCAPATMTSIERMYALYKAVRYVVEAGIPGDFVECGVWRGGSVMMIGATLLGLGVTDRGIHLYDTFEGMAPPTEADRDLDGHSAADLLATAQGHVKELVWALAPMDEVRANLAAIGYPADKHRFVPGKVEDTLPAANPPGIALLRLDTDWYESTRHELEQLYPLLHPGGVLIIDDYGHWQGSRQAVDEFFGQPGRPILLNRIDYTGRIAVKPG